MASKYREIPAVIWPESGPKIPGFNPEYKFILLEVRGLDYLRFELPDDDFHGQVFARLLDDLGVEYDATIVAGIRMPVEDSTEYKIMGIGKMLVELKHKQAMITSKRSAMYNTQSNKETIERLERIAPEWSFFMQ